MKYIRIGLPVIVVLLVLIKFFEPEKNVSTGVAENNIAALYTTPEGVKEILRVSCNDCHSNNTIYPWYSRVQPVAWWLNYHVTDGKRKLNFDEFATYNLRRQYHKLEETEEMVSNNEMPLKSYTLAHREAVLSEHQKQVLIDWSKSIRQQMEALYPIDSLIRQPQKQ